MPCRVLLALASVARSPWRYAMPIEVSLFAVVTALGLLYLSLMIHRLHRRLAILEAERERHASEPY
jgi:hypothetical protein